MDTAVLNHQNNLNEQLQNSIDRRDQQDYQLAGGASNAIRDILEPNNNNSYTQPSEISQANIRAGGFQHPNQHLLMNSLPQNSGGGLAGPLFPNNHH